MILLAILIIQPLPPVPMAPQSVQKGGGLSAKICCISASALCQTGNKDGKIWNSPAIPCSERNSVLLFFSSEECSASEEVFTSTAELCSDSFPLFPSLWNYGIAVTFGNCEEELPKKPVGRQSADRRPTGFA